jgi:transposase-like protein
VRYVRQASSLTRTSKHSGTAQNDRLTRLGRVKWLGTAQNDGLTRPGRVKWLGTAQNDGLTRLGRVKLHSPLIRLESYPAKMYTRVNGRAMEMGSSRWLKEQRDKVALEALSGIKVGVLARRYEVSPSTINGWIRDYREENGDQEYPFPVEQADELKRLLEIEQKYAKAMKMLGEKELENEILRDLLKKPTPAYPRNSK